MRSVICILRVMFYLEKMEKSYYWGQEPRYHPSFAQINNLLDNIFLSATYQALTGTELSTDIISGTQGRTILISHPETN